MNYKNIKKYFPSNKHLYITKDGLDKLKDKLDKLRKQRFAICSRLLQMDPVDKPDYILTNDTLKMLEINEQDATRITEVLLHAETVTPNTESNDIKLGSTVSLKFGNQTIEYMLVDSIEADPSVNKISAECPLGIALMGKRNHETVQIQTPRGENRKYKVLTIG